MAATLAPLAPTLAPIGAPRGPAVLSPTAGAQQTPAPAVRERLSDADSVLIVEYRLPVRLFRRAVQPPEPAAGAPGAGATAGAAAPGAAPGAGAAAAGPPAPSPLSAAAAGAAPGAAPATPAAPGAPAAPAAPAAPSYVWTAEWDPEALLAPKGGMSRALSNIRVKWIGTVSASVPPEDEEAVARLLEPMRCVPVFLPAQARHDFYEGYCKDTLWPIFHNLIDVYGEMPTRWWAGARQSDRWKAYMDANQKFATTVVEQFHEGDLVWVHGA